MSRAVSRRSLRGLAAVGLTAFVVVVGIPATQAALLRGDVDKNGDREITDAIFVLNYLFLGGADPSCDPIADVNADGSVDLSDAVVLLNHLFLGAANPADLSVVERTACGDGPDPEAVLRGMMVYQKPDPLGTLASCSTCHEIIPDAESEFIKAGHSMVDALRRPQFKDGAIANFLAASNVCRVDWMTVKPWADDAADFKDFMAFMESFSTPGPAPALDYEIVCEPQAGPAGNAGDGCKLFNRSCVVCHGANGLGIIDIALSLIDLDALLLNDPEYIRTRIRRSGPNAEDNPNVVYPCLTGNTTMPFWAKDKLSDQQVEDLIAFIGASRASVRAGGQPTDCTKVPPVDGNALRRGPFEHAQAQYGISGVAEELDTKRIRFTDFSYNGTGIVVKAWLFNQGAIRDGVAFGPDLRRGTPYVKETVVVDIPAEHYGADGKLKYDSVSVWCTIARINFADAKLDPVP